MSRVVVYAGTRNIYKNMVTAAKSLLSHTRVDRVWFLIEDDTFPEKLPGVIKTLNVSGQTWFDREGPNAKKRWSYMALMKLALPALFPGMSKIVWLDVDTIVRKDIGELLDTKLGDCILGAVEEPMRSKAPFRYYNTGVMVMNLEAMRGETMNALVWMANGYPMDFPDQDAINLVCQGRIKPISPYYNSNYWIVEVDDPAIQHFAADRTYWERDLWKEYEQMEWRVI